MKILKITDNDRLVSSQGDVDKFKKYNVVIVDSFPEIEMKINELLSAYIKGRNTQTLFSSLIDEIKKFKDEFSISNAIDTVNINDWLVELQWILEDPVHDEYPYLYAQFNSFTQLISSYLYYLQFKDSLEIEWIDNRDFIITNNEYENPTIDEEITHTRLSTLQNNALYIMQSRLATTDDNNSTILAKDWNETLFA